MPPFTNIPPNPFTDPKKLAKRSIFDRAGEKVRSLVDAAFDSAIEAVEKQKQQKKKLSPELQVIWDGIEDRIESGEIQNIDLTIGDKTKQDIEKELKVKNIKIGEYAQDMLNSKDFTTATNPEPFNLIKLSVADLGFPRDATYKEICDKANELGLDLCPAEVGPHLRLQDKWQLLNNWYGIAMKPILARDGFPRFFSVDHIDDGLWLSYGSGRPGDRYLAYHQFVFVKPV